MKVLYAKTFGLGNAVMAVPAIRALREFYGRNARIDVLVGSLPDDGGAKLIIDQLALLGIVDVIFVNTTSMLVEYDVAILAIPYDGRWVNGQHFRAKTVMDGRTRPDPSTTGLVSWKDHEIQYQMDNVRALGYSGETPTCSFGYSEDEPLFDIYLGLGYKKDAAGFWKVKHWGNENYARFLKLLLERDNKLKVMTSGDMADFQLSIRPICRLLGDELSKRFHVMASSDLKQAINMMTHVSMYVGNDTGMMHVAASVGIKTMGLFFMENAIVKNHPWTPHNFSIDASNRVLPPEEVVTNVMEALSCKKQKTS